MNVKNYIIAGIGLAASGLALMYLSKKLSEPKIDLVMENGQIYIGLPVHGKTEYFQYAQIRSSLKPSFVKRSDGLVNKLIEGIEEQ